MKIAITTLGIVALAALIVLAIVLQERGYADTRQYIKECANRHGFITTVDSGWVHKTLMCSK